MARQVYFGDWEGGWTEVQKDLSGTRYYDDGKTEKMAKPDEVLFAGYDVDGYDGSAFLLYREGDRYYTREGSHCSCYGLETAMSEAEEYDLPTLVAVLERRDDRYYDPLCKDRKKKVLAVLRRRLKKTTRV